MSSRILISPAASNQADLRRHKRIVDVHIVWISVCMATDKSFSLQSKVCGSNGCTVWSSQIKAT
jgi:hypothetical protein